MVLHRPARDEIDGVIEVAAKTAGAYLGGVDERPAGAVDPQVIRHFDPSLPQDGIGAQAAIEELVAHGLDGTGASAGPRFFHFVIGGVTPASLGADWITSAWDQHGYAWVSSPLASDMERLSIRWLRDLFGLPPGPGVLTSGATMANYVAVACARQAWGEAQGHDVAEDGLAGLPPMPVVSGGYVHPSLRKALAMAGIGRRSVRVMHRDDAGRCDLDGVEGFLAETDGPALVVANAGEVNAGDFDDIEALADLAAEHGAWLHVDGAFGLFAALSPRTMHLVAGLERADSITCDGHKWLNMPYDCGFAFVRDEALMGRTFTNDAAYLPTADAAEPVWGALGPENSRRARSFGVWATLRAYGRSGIRAMVEHNLDLAQHLARRVDDAPDLQRLAEVPLCIVCFRYDPGGLDGPALDRLNARLGQEILRDGRVTVGTTVYEGKVALRPATVNWRTRTEDVDLLVDVVREIGARLHTG